jgi:hypothetical protein
MKLRSIRLFWPKLERGLAVCVRGVRSAEEKFTTKLEFTMILLWLLILTTVSFFVVPAIQNITRRIKRNDTSEKGGLLEEARSERRQAISTDQQAEVTS